MKKLDVIAQNQNHFRNQGVEVEISVDLCYQ
jgi:hypothetical protein